MKKILIIITGLFLLIPSSLHANSEVGLLAKNWFTTFSSKISQKYSDEKEIIYFEGFSKKIYELLTKKDFTSAQVDLLEDLIMLSNERVFKIKKSKLESSTKIILRTNSLINGFKHYSYNDEHIFLENGIWYAYKFDSHLTFPKGVSIKQEDLSYNKIDSNSTLVFLRKDNALGFANDYTKIKLISDDIIYGIPDKFSFLSEIKDDKKKIVTETDQHFKSLKIKTYDLTKGKSEREKIKLIYKFILENIEYPTSFTLTDYEIFSGINTYKNKSGVCEGYTKLFKYMLNFSGINDTEVIRGYVLDAQDFPQVGHAWTRIGEQYFDPTFDDPIGQKTTKEYSKYNYYSLPYDLFYTNRYNFEKIPSYLKDESLEARKSFIAKRLAPMVYKYKFSNYNILKPFTLKLEYGIELEKKLDLEDLKLIIDYYEVDNFKFVRNGVTKSIKTLQYYKVNDSQVDSVLEQLNYNFDGYYLFKWNLDSGGSEYRLGYDVKFN